MKNIITINDKNISDATTKTCNARDLHEFLEVRRDFNTWIKQRIAKYGFVEGDDFVCFEDLSSPDLGSSKSRQQRIKEYHLTLDMAKELSMVENNERGRQARRYFIACERALASIRYAEVPDYLNRYAEIHGKIGDIGLDIVGFAMEIIADRLKNLTPYGKAAILREILEMYGINMDELSSDPRTVDHKTLGKMEVLNAMLDNSMIRLIFEKCLTTIQ